VSKAGDSTHQKKISVSKMPSNIVESFFISLLT
jgi:hypothetical protein